MSRFWPDGLPIEVSCDALLAPMAFRWKRQHHRVVAIQNRWRVDEGWWRRRVWREYFVLTTHSGLLIEIYHDVRSNSWWLQRLYD